MLFNQWLDRTFGLLYNYFIRNLGRSNQRCPTVRIYRNPVVGNQPPLDIRGGPASYSGVNCQNVGFKCPIASIRISASSRGINSAVECQPSKLNVTGSNPVFRFRANNSVVECLLYTEGVGGSNPSLPIYIK